MFEKTLFMNLLFKKARLSGIMRPGECYILSAETQEERHMEPIELTYLIRNEEELRSALDMEFFIVRSEYLRVRRFAGFERKTNDCILISVSCYDKEKKAKVIERIYLHRLMSLSEGRKRICEIYEVTE